MQCFMGVFPSHPEPRMIQSSFALSIFKWRNFAEVHTFIMVAVFQGGSCMRPLHSKLPSRGCLGLCVPLKAMPLGHPAQQSPRTTKLTVPDRITGFPFLLRDTRGFLQLLVNTNIYVKEVYPDFVRFASRGLLFLSPNTQNSWGEKLAFSKFFNAKSWTRMFSSQCSLLTNVKYCSVKKMAYYIRAYLKTIVSIR